MSSYGQNIAKLVSKLSINPYGNDPKTIVRSQSVRIWAEMCPYGNGQNDRSQIGHLCAYAGVLLGRLNSLQLSPQLRPGSTVSSTRLPKV